MKRVILIRHGESVWNRDKRLTGWTDIDLSERGVEETRIAADYLIKSGYHFKKAYCSYLRRAEHTLEILIERYGQGDIALERSWRLNENHYGLLQGMYRDEVALVYGEEKAKAWLASYNSAPPPVTLDDMRNPHNDPLYEGLDNEPLPLSESYADLSRRVVPYWRDIILPSSEQYENILVVAHGNSLREILKYQYKIDDKEIFRINLASATPVILDL